MKTLAKKWRVLSTSFSPPTLAMGMLTFVALNCSFNFLAFFSHHKTLKSIFDVDSLRFGAQQRIHTWYPNPLSRTSNYVHARNMAGKSPSNENGFDKRIFAFSTRLFVSLIGSQMGLGSIFGNCRHLHGSFSPIQVPCIYRSSVPCGQEKRRLLMRSDFQFSTPNQNNWKKNIAPRCLGAYQSLYFSLEHKWLQIVNGLNDFRHNQWS